MITKGYINMRITALTKSGFMVSRMCLYAYMMRARQGGFHPPQTPPNAVLQDPDYATLEADDRSDCRMSIG